MLPPPLKQSLSSKLIHYHLLPLLLPLLPLPPHC
jgi:hypothetical protein